VTEPARELRFAITVDDLDAAIRVFREAFGLEVRDEFRHGDGRGVIIDVPTATLELFDAGYTDHVDEIEAGRALGERVRIAVRVASLEAAADAVAAAGASQEAGPVETPWGDHNHRWKIPGATQLTLFASGGPARS
jgi:predicted enzyme related to lactoylglutathione lyase